MNLLQLLLFSAATFSELYTAKAPLAQKEKKEPEKEPCCLIQGEPLCCYEPAYNAPAAIAISTCGSDLFADAAFTYWFAEQEGLKIANNGIGSAGIYYFAEKTHTLTQPFDYKPGFKVGLGAVVNQEWTLRAGYTWYRGKTSFNSKTISDASLTAGTEAALSGVDVWVVDDWFLEGTNSGQALSGPHVSSSWKLSLDLIDLTMGRPFYQGRRLIVSPFAGLRSALIRQSMTVELTELATLFASIPSQPIGSRNHSNSWSIGPRVGCSGQYLMGAGWRMEGDFAASLLYTRYTSVKHSEDRASLGFNPVILKASLDNYSALRPNAELGLGLGWGTYSYCQKYHFDMSATYDFMIFWSQNMMRKLLDDTLTGTSPAPADLFLHGLTATARLDF